MRCVHYIRNLLLCCTHFAHLWTTFCICAKCASQEKYWAHAQNVRRRYTLQYVCSLRTILKICAKYAQFAHNPQDMCTICAVCAHNKIKKFKKRSSAPVAGHPSKYWAGPMFEYRCFQCGMVSDTYSYSRRPFICAATLPKVSVLIVCNGNSSMSWVKRSGSFKYN